jgi:hypothetical protein
LSIVRIAVAVLIFIHGAFRASHWDPYVTGFGEWLSSIGFPQGFYWAVAVTIYELVGPIFILARRFVTLACLGHIVIVGLGMDLSSLSGGLVRRRRRAQRDGIFRAAARGLDRRGVGVRAAQSVITRSAR